MPRVAGTPGPRRAGRGEPAARDRSRDGVRGVRPPPRAPGAGPDHRRPRRAGGIPADRRRGGRTEGKNAEARRAHHRRRLAEPDPPPKRLTVQEERAALRALLDLPPSEKDLVCDGAKSHRLDPPVAAKVCSPPRFTEGRAWTSRRSASSSPRSRSSSSGSTTASPARTPAPTCRCTSPGSSPTSPRRASSRSPSTPACRRGPSRSSSASTTGTTTGCATDLQQIVRDEHAGPHSIGDLRRDQRRQEGGQDPRRAAAVVRRRRQEGELHRHGPPGLRPRRLPLPARRRAVPARESWSDDRDRCREAGIPDDMVYRPKWKIALELYDRAVGQRPALRLADVRRGLRRQARVPAGAVGPRPEVRGRGAAELHGLDQAAAGRHPAVPQARPRPRPQDAPPGQRQPAAAAGRRDARPGRACATSPGSGGGSRTGTRGRWSGRSSTCGSTPWATTACRASRCT